jgi:hypothetical protein
MPVEHYKHEHALDTESVKDGDSSNPEEGPKE